MATAQPAGQARNAFGRDHGNYATVAAMPNGSGNVLPSATVPFTVEAGDRCYLSLAGGECEYLCVSAGTSGGGNAVWVPSSGQGPWSSVLYVDGVRGSDTTGQRGNANRPFATIQAAINAAQTMDLVQLAAQLFTLAASLTIPATVTALSIAGIGGGGIFQSPFAATVVGTVVYCPTNHALNLGANLGLVKLLLQDFELASLGGAGKAALFGDGSAYASGTFLTTGLYAFNMVFAGFGATGGVSLKYASTLFFNGCTGTGPSSFVNFGPLEFYSSSFNSACTISSDVSDPLTPQQQPTCSVYRASYLGGQGVVGLVSWGGQVAVYVDASSALGGLKGATLSDHTAAPVAHPSIRCAGRIASANSGVIDFSAAGSEIPDTATALTLDFRTMKIATDASTPTFRAKVGGVGPANFQTVRLDAVVSVPGITVTADAKIRITARGADFPQAVYTTPGADGDIIPPILIGTISLAAGGTVVQTWVGLGYAGLVRTGAAPDYAAINSIVQGADAVISAVSTTGFTTIATAQAGNTGARWKAQWK